MFHGVLLDQKMLDQSPLRLLSDKELSSRFHARWGSPFWDAPSLQVSLCVPLSFSLHSNLFTSSPLSWFFAQIHTRYSAAILRSVPFYSATSVYSAPRRSLSSPVHPLRSPYFFYYIWSSRQNSTSSQGYFARAGLSNPTSNTFIHSLESPEPSQIICPLRFPLEYTCIHTT